MCASELAHVTATIKEQNMALTMKQKNNNNNRSLGAIVNAVLQNFVELQNMWPISKNR